MKRGICFKLFLAMVLLAMPIVYAQVSDCYTAATCMPPFVNAGNLSLDGHFLGSANGLNKLCCKDITPGTGVVSFKYSDNGHVSVNTTVTDFPNNVRLGFPAECSLKTNCALNGKETCVMKVVNQTPYRADNSHIYDCTDTTAGKAKLCCTFDEMCGNGKDDDYDGFIDCTDSDCHDTPVECTGSPLTSDACITLNRDVYAGTSETIYNQACNNTAEAGGAGRMYYCSYPADGTPTGICCGSGLVAKCEDGSCYCGDSDPCGLTAQDPIRSCAFDFDDDNSEWVDNYYDGDASNWCVSRMPNLYNPDELSFERSSACCLMVKQGEVNYYTDNDNVKIFGTS